MKKITISNILKLQLICIVVTIFSFQSCQQGSLIEQLSEGYLYHDGGENYKDIIGRKNLSPLTTLTSNLKYIKEKNIYSKVVDYSFDNEFILVAQEPNKRGHTVGMKFELEDIYPSTKGESIADSLIKNDPYFQIIFSRKLNYWIISHKENSLFGPYSKEKYLEKREELGVPEELKLEF